MPSVLIEVRKRDPKDHVEILLREVPPENWGIRGGQAACDVELGFKVDV